MELGSVGVPGPGQGAFVRFTLGCAHSLLEGSKDTSSSSNASALPAWLTGTPSLSPQAGGDIIFILTQPYLVLQYFRLISPQWAGTLPRLQPGQICESATTPDPAALAQLSSESCSSFPQVVPNQLFCGWQKGYLSHA